MDTQTHKLLIAAEYLETAAVLWTYEINYFSALHLAAAAEEISGKACRIAGKLSHFDMVSERARRALDAMGIAHTKTQLRDAAYAAKNSVKHMDSQNDTTVSIDARKNAADYIVSAHHNFKTLGIAASLSETVKTVVEVNTLHVEIDA